MIKGFLLVGIILQFSSCFAQDQNCAGKDSHLYMGKELKVRRIDSTRQKVPYIGFTRRIVEGESYIKTDPQNAVYWNGHSFGLSIYDSLIGKTFTCKAVIPVTEGNLCYQWQYLSYLELSNAQTGTIYYKYNSRTPCERFPFEVLGGLFPDSSTEENGVYCKEIMHELEKSNDILRYYTPRSEPIWFSKRIEKDSINYYMILKVLGKNPNYREKGAVIVLETGMRITRPMIGIEEGYSEGKYTYSVAIKLTSEEITMLKTSKIKSFRLYKYDQKTVNGERYNGLLNCLISAK
ncbi:hypothetical protein [Xanthocytophaga flava]|uniref:hypothetical protein n=1 Tax=Xanthocytophaga flava TaxID=3048013 RepID=UPI0028D73EBF|nr:hypothetical protein [Xanthocytophaga flavus]MDJ1471009.1 hypothetical protein [Xanthocytophaga flavus]